MIRKPDALHLDGGAGLFSGLMVWLFSEKVATFHHWPPAFIQIHVVASLTYGLLALWLANQTIRPLRLITALACANVLWATFCATAAWHFFPTLTWLGHLHLIFEATAIGALALYELKNRHHLRLNLSPRSPR